MRKQAKNPVFRPLFWRTDYQNASPPIGCTANSNKQAVVTVVILTMQMTTAYKKMPSWIKKQTLFHSDFTAYTAFFPLLAKNMGKGFCNFFNQNANPALPN